MERGKRREGQGAERGESRRSTPPRASEAGRREGGCTCGQATGPVRLLGGGLPAPREAPGAYAEAESGRGRPELAAGLRMAPRPDRQGLHAPAREGRRRQG